MAARGIVQRAYRVMTFNCDVSGNHGRLTDSDTLRRAAILHAEEHSHPPRERKMKKKREEREKSRRRRLRCIVSINRVNSRENNSELMNVTVAMATSIARNCFIFIASRRAML